MTSESVPEEAGPVKILKMNHVPPLGDIRRNHGIIYLVIVCHPGPVSGRIKANGRRRGTG
jgi:hypothetical protein